MLNQIIEEAEQNQQYKFYYCDQLEFRGRVYPVGEYLTTQGNKLGRRNEHRIFWNESGGDNGKISEDERWESGEESDRNIKKREKRSKYMKRDIGYLDATCSGTQLVWLIRGDEEYAKELNIIESSGIEKAGDFI